MSLDALLKLGSYGLALAAVFGLGINVFAFDQVVALLERYFSPDGSLKESTRIMLEVRIYAMSAFAAAVAGFVHACSAAAFRERLRVIVWYEPGDSRAPSPASTTSVLSAAVLVLLMMSLLGQYLTYVLGAGESKPALLIYGYFNLDQEHWVPTTFSAGLLLYSALLLGNIAGRTSSYGLPFAGHWLVLSLAFVFLSADEKFRIHERVFDFLMPYLDVNLPVFWVVPAGVLTLLGGLAYLRFVFHLRAAYRLLLLVSAGMYLGGAIGMEIIGRGYARDHGIDNFPYEMLANVEELLEMLGIVLFIYALQSYLSRMAAGDLVDAPAPQMLRS